MAHVLIVYATREGQTEKIAGRIAEHMREAGAEVVVHHAADSVAPEGPFDLVVYGGSMHAGGVERELLEFMRDRHERLAAGRAAFFLVLLSAAGKDPVRREAELADARARLERQLPVAFDDVEMIAGALKYSKYPWPLKWMMKRIARAEGGDTDTSRDYEYTDWNQVARYARRLVETAGE